MIATFKEFVLTKVVNITHTCVMFLKVREPKIVEKVLSLLILLLLLYLKLLDES